MQVTIDIPETQYREFETRAAQQRRPLEDVVLSETLRTETEDQFQERMRNRYPLIKGNRPGTMAVLNKASTKPCSLPTMKLLDVNVWIALAHGAHPQSQQANEWMQTVKRDDYLFFCRTTQIGFLRVLSGYFATGVEPLTQRDAWSRYDDLFEDPRVRYAEEPQAVEALLRQRSMRDIVAPKLWTDDYLAVFAQAAGLTVVTFDRPFAARTPNSILLA